MTTRIDRVAGFDLPVWLPEGGTGPGLLLVHEIFGLDGYLRSVAEELAADGYVVAVPDLFWRTHPGWSSAHDDQGVAASMAVADKFDHADGITDLTSALAHLRGLPEVSGKVGALGFCLGGSLSFQLAAQADPDAVVSYYGFTVSANLHLLPQISCPVQIQFGGKDQFIPRDAVAEVERAVAGRANIEMYVEELAGHAFLNHSAPQFHQPEPAARAWQRTQEFLTRTLRS
ncbi:dienelactone hydrolase family protein [Amycolatopsis jejuensis]|uniref:dienelactone hydrolase family protein n=1 Tax=Amycolatopsis jejuensis TaxID=330084 RepID=UPI0005273E41|nr:dienelactone hydrolase family protein [Amycolatopsis jejuensis]